MNNKKTTSGKECSAVKEQNSTRSSALAYAGKSLVSYATNKNNEIVGYSSRIKEDQ